MRRFVVILVLVILIASFLWFWRDMETGKGSDEFLARLENVEIKASLNGSDKNFRRESRRERLNQIADGNVLPLPPRGWEFLEEIRALLNENKIDEARAVAILYHERLFDNWNQRDLLTWYIGLEDGLEKEVLAEAVGRYFMGVQRKLKKSAHNISNNSRA